MVRVMIWALALFLMWPFHKHTSKAPEVLPAGCSRALSGDMEFMFDGEDGAVGFGPSCDAAFQEWRHIPAPPKDWKI